MGLSPLQVTEMTSRTGESLALGDLAVDELSFVAGADAWPLVPEGTYEVQYVSHCKRPFFKAMKLYVEFQVCAGDHMGVRLFRAYNLYQPLKRGCDLLRDLELLSGRSARKNARLQIGLFKNRVIEVKVRTVTASRKQVHLAEHQRYSVVDCISRVLTGEGSR